MPTRHHASLWPGLLAVGPLVIAFVYLAHAQGWAVITKTPNEIYAVSILGPALLAFLYRAWQTRRLLHLLMAGFAFTAWMREWHFGWTHDGVYLMLAVLMGLAWWQRDNLKPQADTGSFMPWFKGTLVVYFLSVLVAKRVFRDILPNEQPVHVALEELLENAAHTMLLLTALVGCRHWRSESSLQKSFDLPRSEGPHST